MVKDYPLVDYMARQARITSYNVCYTKLLRYIFTFLKQLISQSFKSDTMKQLLFILSFALLGFQGCTAKNQENGTSGSGEVSQTTTSENGSSLITKEQFLKEVWNYNDSPNDWKFLGEQPVIIDFYARNNFV